MQMDIRELLSSHKSAQNNILSTFNAIPHGRPSLLLPLMPIGTAAGAGGPQRGGSNGPPLLPATEDVCSSKWELLEKELRA